MSRRRERVVAVCVSLLLCSAGCLLATPATGTTEAEPGDESPPTVQDSDERIVGVAEVDARRGNAEEAIAGYGYVLVNSSDRTMRGATVNGLLAVAGATESSDRAADRYGTGCGVDMVAHSAYSLILGAEDRADYLGDSFDVDAFYSDAAASDARLVECAGRSGVPWMTAENKIDYLLDAAAYYPADDGVLNLLGEPLPGVLVDVLVGASSIHEFRDARDAVLEVFDVKSGAIDRATDSTAISLLYDKHCETYDPEWSTDGLTSARKLLPCPSADKKVKLRASSLVAGSLKEARYSLTYAYSGGGVTECKLWDASTRAPVYFERDANFAETFTLVDLHTGTVASSKVFASTPMGCCTSGKYYPDTYDGRHHEVAECVGGRDPEPTYSEEALVSWLESATD